MDNNNNVINDNDSDNGNDSAFIDIFWTILNQHNGE